jgi:hypothetical protein
MTITKVIVYEDRVSRVTIFNSYGIVVRVNGWLERFYERLFG